MTALKIYERKVDETILKYLAGAITYGWAIRVLKDCGMTTIEAKAALEQALDDCE